MKRILTVAALTAVAASPALAAGSRSWQSPRAQALESYAAAEAPAGYGYADPVTGYPYAGPATVVEQGMIVGADPDPNVRLELKRSAPHNNVE